MTRLNSPRTRLLDAPLVDADLAGGGDDGGPGVVGERDALGQALLARAVLWIAGCQHLAPGRGRLGALEIGDVAGDVLGEEAVGVHHRRIDVEREHAVAAEAIPGFAA